MNSWPRSGKPSTREMDGSAFWKDAGRLREGVLTPAKARKFEVAHQSHLRMPDSAPQSVSALVMEKVGVDIFDGRYLVIGQRAELLFPRPLREMSSVLPEKSHH